MGKRKNNKRTIIGTMRNTQGQGPAKYSPEWAALQAKMALDYLTPLFVKEKMDPISSLILAAAWIDYQSSGQERKISENYLLAMCNVIVTSWQLGMFSPNASYPHTLEATLAALEEANKEDGDEA